MDESFDIIVVGGGTAGVVAAIQSSRAGMRTLLVEKNGLPGGTMTAAGIAFPGLFFAWGHQIIAGIGWELVSEAAAESGLPLPDFSSPDASIRFWRYQVQLNPVVYSALCDEKLLGSGVDVLYHTMVAEVKPEDDTVELRLCTLEGLRAVRARRVIDCTGDASVCALAGYEVIHPSECQPATMSCKLAGYDFNQLDQAGLCAAIDRAVAAGELRYTDLGWNKNGASLQFLSKYGDNANHIFRRCRLILRKDGAGWKSKPGVLCCGPGVFCADSPEWKIFPSDSVPSNAGSVKVPSSAARPPSRRKITVPENGIRMRSAIHFIRSTCMTVRRGS